MERGNEIKKWINKMMAHINQNPVPPIKNSKRLNGKRSQRLRVIRVKKIISVVAFLTLIVATESCNYRAGNRKPDIHYRLGTNISGYYIKKYMIGQDTQYFNHGPQNSEASIYFENFIPVTDSLLGLKYLIEFSNLDSIEYVHHGEINLASIYSFKKDEWIKKKDSLPLNWFDSFSDFFKTSILKNVVQTYSKVIPDSILFTEKPDSILLYNLDLSR